MSKEVTGMDLVVSFDTTGSMFPVLAQVRQKVEVFVRDMFNSMEDLRVGIIAHGDYCDKDDPYTIRIMDFTTDEEKICEFIRTTQKTHGGDADECYELVLNMARTQLNWGAGRRKVFVLIGDASPHAPSYPENKDHLSWSNEAGVLNDMGVKILAVHAMAYYRSRAFEFYNGIAKATGGVYLTLDQFSEITNIIKAACAAEYSEEKLNEYVSIIKKNGEYTRSMDRNIRRLRGEDIGLERGDDYKNRNLTMRRPLIGRESLSIKTLEPVEPGRFQAMVVPEDTAIKQYVESNGIEFRKGRGFYELTKHETVQQYKEIILQDRETGDMFTGPQVRAYLGLEPQTEKGGVNQSLNKRDAMEFRIFVQSTSVNRKLIGGTAFLYEVADIEDTGSTVIVDEKIGKMAAKGKKPAAASKKPVAKKPVEKKVETVEKKATTKKKNDIKLGTDVKKQVDKECKAPVPKAKAPEKAKKAAAPKAKTPPKSKATKKPDLPKLPEKFDGILSGEVAKTPAEVKKPSKPKKKATASKADEKNTTIPKSLQVELEDCRDALNEYLSLPSDADEAKLNEAFNSFAKSAVNAISIMIRAQMR